MTDPWDWYIYLPILQLVNFLWYINVAKYTSPMDPMGFHVKYIYIYVYIYILGGSTILQGYSIF